MTTATKPFINRLAIVFDFDETLAPDTFSLLLENMGLDADAFKQEKVKPLVEQQLKPFLGVPEMFERLRQCAQNLIEDVDVEFYLIFGGFIISSN